MLFKMVALLPILSKWFKMCNLQINKYVIVLTATLYRAAQKNWHTIFVRLNFTKVKAIFKIILLSESGEN